LPVLRFRLSAARRLLVGGAATVLVAVAGAAAAGTVASTPSAAPSFNAPVHAVVYSGDVVYVGGAFSQVVISGRLVPRQRLAAFNARTGALLAWNPAANGTVRALTMAGSTLYAAGDFTVVAGQPRRALAGISAAGTVTAFHPTLTGSALALASGSGLLYVGGQLTSAGGLARTNAAAFWLSTGKPAAWAPRVDGEVDALAAYGTRVYLGGRFRTAGGFGSARHLAVVSATTGAVDNHFLPNAPQLAYGLTADASGVYVAHGGNGGRLVAYTTAGVPRWTRLFDGDAQTVTLLAGTVYVGGHFDKACAVATPVSVTSCPGGSVARGKFAALTTTGVLTGWAPSANGIVGVRVLAASPTLGQIAAGGDFTTVNGAVQKRYATFATPPPVSPSGSTSPLIASYDFDTVVGAGSFTDGAGTGHLLQAFTSGGATLGTVARQNGRAVTFPPRCDGSGCPRLVLQTAGTADLNPGSGPIRFGARVLLAGDQTDDGENILQKGYSTAGGQYKLQVDKTAGKPSCSMASDGDPTIHLVKSSVGVADGQWHTLECRRAGAGLSILVDGAVTGTITIPAGLTVNNTAPLVLGGKGLSDNNDQYHGSLDDAWISRT
jgi:hypothetical protein